MVLDSVHINTLSPRMHTIRRSKYGLTFATTHSSSSRQKSSGPTPTPWKVSRRRNRSRIVRSQNAGACSLLQLAFMSLGCFVVVHIFCRGGRAAGERAAGACPKKYDSNSQLTSSRTYFVYVPPTDALKFNRIIWVSERALHQLLCLLHSSP